MKRPANNAWFEKQMCGPLVVYFTVHEGNYDAEIVVEWQICPDDEDKAEERAFASSDHDIRGPKRSDRCADRSCGE